MKIIVTIKDKKKCEKLCKSISQFAYPEAAETLARLIIKESHNISYNEAPKSKT